MVNLGGLFSQSIACSIIVLEKSSWNGHPQITNEEWKCSKVPSIELSSSTRWENANGDDRHISRTLGPQLWVMKDRSSFGCLVTLNDSNCNCNHQSGQSAAKLQQSKWERSMNRKHISRVHSPVVCSYFVALTVYNRWKTASCLKWNDRSVKKGKREGMKSHGGMAKGAGGVGEK